MGVMDRGTGGLTVRAASVADIPDLARHFRRQAEAVLKYAVAAEIVPDADWRGYAQDRLADPSTHILVATDAGGAVGSVELRLSHAAGLPQTRRQRVRSFLRALTGRFSGRGTLRVVQNTGIRARIEHVFVEAESGHPLLFRVLVHAAQAAAIDLNADVLDADLAAANVRLWRAFNSLRFENERVLVSKQLKTEK